MKVACFADIHLRGSDLDVAACQLRAAAAAVRSRGCGLVTVSGDFFDKSSIGDSHASTGAIAEVAHEFVELLRGCPMIVVRGDHDVSGAGARDALHVFGAVHRVRVVREPAFFSRDDTDLTILAIPYDWSWTNPEQVIVDALKDAVVDGCDLFLGHFGVSGMALNAHRAAEADPEKLRNRWMISPTFLMGIPARHFALGDFHRRQEILVGQGGYVGALRQLNHGESGNPAGFEIWDSATNETEWIELDAAPRYRTVVVKPGDPAPVTGENEKLRIQYVGHRPDGAVVRQQEAAGAAVEIILEREERLRRAEVPTGIIERPRDLIDLYAGTQNPPWDEARLARARKAFDALTG